MVSEELQKNGRQLFKLQYTDPDEPETTRSMYHHFDNGKQCMQWHQVATRIGTPSHISLSDSPAVTRSQTTTTS